MQVGEAQGKKALASQAGVISSPTWKEVVMAGQGEVHVKASRPCCGKHKDRAGGAHCRALLGL